MNIASSYTVLAVRKGSSGFCKVECSPRSWRGILVLRKLIGLDRREEPALYMTYQPLTASISPQEASAPLVLPSPWAILGNNGTRKVWGILEERQGSNSFKEICWDIFISVLSPRNHLKPAGVYSWTWIPSMLIAVWLWIIKQFCWEGSLWSHLAQYRWGC